MRVKFLTRSRGLTYLQCLVALELTRVSQGGFPEAV